MSKPGPKEMQTAALRQDRAADIPPIFRRGHPDCIVKDVPRSQMKPAPAKASAGVTLAPPLSVQKAIAADFEDDQPPKAEPVPEAQQETDDMQRKTTKTTKASKSKKVAPSKTKGKSANTSTTKSKAANAKVNGVRAGSKLQIVVNLLKREGGCTTADILAATDWPSVSVPQQAKAAGLTLKKEKIGKVTRYSAA